MINPSVEISLCWRAILGALRKRLTFIAEEAEELRILAWDMRLTLWRWQYWHHERKRRPK